MDRLVSEPDQGTNSFVIMDGKQQQNMYFCTSIGKAKRVPHVDYPGFKPAIDGLVLFVETKVASMENYDNN